MNKYRYIGYGFLGSKKKENEVDIKSTKAYKALRAAFVDEIIIEVADPSDTSRNKLREIITENLTFGSNGWVDGTKENIVLVVPTVETLGGIYEEAVSTYCFLTDSYHIIILNRPDLSTFTMDGKVLVELNDIDTIGQLRAEFACARMTTRGRKAIPLDAKFRKVFWEWQNYYIDTKDAIELLGCSRATLYSLSKEFMTSFAFSDVYMKEYDNLENSLDKAVRGIVLDDDTNEILICAQRHMGDNWTLEGFNVAVRGKQFKFKYGMWNDYLRLRLNYKYGRAAMSYATKTYSKGIEHVQKLREELNTM